MIFYRVYKYILMLLLLSVKPNKSLIKCNININMYEYCTFTKMGVKLQTRKKDE